jgi:predicted ATPase
LDEEQDRIRLYEAITQFLIAVSRQSPLLLLLEDMHWADEASLNLLEHFVRSASDCPALTVCCYRSEDTGPTSPLYKTIMRLNRERLVETIPVRNLSIEETRDMIGRVFGEQNVSTEFTGLIYQRTGGNPFFVEEVLRSLVEDGTIYRSGTGWDRKPIQEIVVPQSVKATLRSRLNKLDPGLLGVLAWAAVIGPNFEFELLHEVSQLEEDKLLRGLEEALASGLLLEIPGRKDVFRFTDNRIRELLLGDLSQSRRARYHVKVAEALEKIHSKNIDRHIESLADHYSEAGDAERGIKYSIMAGDRNKSIHASEQAINNYKRALDLIELEGGNDEEKASVLEKLAESYSHAGQYQNGARFYEQALTIFEKLHDGKACARACLGLLQPVRPLRF